MCVVAGFSRLASRFSTGLTRIAINEALARVRRRGRYDAFDDERPGAAVTWHELAIDPERQAAVGELRRMLEWAIDSLPNGMREVFVLRDVEGLSTLDAAACLGVSGDVVKTRLSRARAALRRLLIGEPGWPPTRSSISIGHAAIGSWPRCSRRSVSPLAPL